jgi:hypothetical protein
MKADSIEVLVKHHNPFFAKDGNEIKYFRDYGEAYLYAMRKLDEQFPRGYVDMALYLHSTTGQPLLACEREVKKMKMLKRHNDYIVLLRDNRGEQTKERYEAIIKSLHQLSQTTFSQDFFNWAWQEFQSRKT